jgi:hypothetical protein
MLKLIRQELARDANGIQRKIQNGKDLYPTLDGYQDGGKTPPQYLG